MPSMIGFLEKGKKQFKLKTKFKLTRRVKAIIIVIFLLILAVVLFQFKHLFIAAVVDNRPIARWTLDRELEKQGGQQVLDSLINEGLILGEAKRQGIKIDEGEIKARVSGVEEQIKAQGSDLDSFLQAQGMTRTGLEKQITIQLVVEKVLGNKVSVTEEEIQDYFEKNKDLFATGTKLEEVKGEIEDQLKREKMNTEFQSWLQELREKSKVRYFVEF